MWVALRQPPVTLTSDSHPAIGPPSHPTRALPPHTRPAASSAFQGSVMKIRNSLRAAKTRDKNCRVVRRRGRVYVINKKNPRMKARQG